MYNLLDYGMMLAHKERIEAYTAAMERAIGPDSVVLDIGTGTGIFALIACRLRARRVYAVDTNDAIVVARQIAADNGFGERIEFIQDLSTNITLPELADVAVSEIGGEQPLFDKHVPSIIDARERLLAPGGRLIPQADVLLGALAECPEDCRRLTVWDEFDYGFDMSAAQELARNNCWRERARTGQLLTAEQRWGRLDYATVQDPNLRGEFMTTAAEAGTADALLLWGQRIFADGIELADYLNPTSLYRRLVFPLREPTVVAVGDAVRCQVDAFLHGDDYTWRWRTTITDGETGLVKADFDQTTVAGVPLSRETLEHAPSSTA